MTMFGYQVYGFGSIYGSDFVSKFARLRISEYDSVVRTASIVNSNHETLAVTSFDSIASQTVDSLISSNRDVLSFTAYPSPVVFIFRSAVFSNSESLSLTAYQTSVFAGVNANVVSGFNTVSLTSYDSVVTSSVATGFLFEATFTAPDGTDLSAYTPDTPAAGYIGTNVPGAWHIHGNALASEDFTLANGPSDYVAWDLGATPPDTYTIRADVRVFPDNANTGNGIFFCSTNPTTPTDDCYFYNFYTEDLYLDPRSGGSFGSNLGTDTGIVVTAGLLYELRVDVSPTGLVCYLDDVEIFNVSDTAFRGRYFGYATYFHNNTFVSANAPLLDNLVVELPTTGVNVVSDFRSVAFTSYASTIEAISDVNVVSDFRSVAFTSYDSSSPSSPAAPGGFIELAGAYQARTVLNTPAQLSFLPSGTGEFTFPAPYSTTGVKLTDSAGNYASDVIQAHGYSYWPQINAHAGQNELRVFVGLPVSEGGTSYITYNKVTGVVSSPVSVFSPAADYVTEGFFWHPTDPDILFFTQGGTLRQVDVTTNTVTTLFDLATRSGNNWLAVQAHCDNAANIFSMTYQENFGSFVRLGIAVWNRTADTYTLYPSTASGTLDEGQIDKSGQWLLIKDQIDAAQGEDNRIVDLSDDSERTILDPAGAAGHSDNGFGYMVAADNYASNANTFKVWDFTQGSLSGTTVYYNADWNAQAPAHISHCNAEDGVPIADQFVVGSSLNNETTAHTNEIIAIPLDGSRSVLVIAPVMTDLNAAGGVQQNPGAGTYYKDPKGSVDFYGEYFCWSSNHGTDRNDLFLVRIPKQLLA